MKTKYHGIIDCHGVESFTQAEGGRASLYQIRAAANPQRYATYYKVDLDPSELECVEKLLAESRWKKACEVLKDIGVEADDEYALDRCPDPNADPMHIDEEEEDHR